MVNRFYEKKEHYDINSKKDRLATDYLKVSDSEMPLVNGRLPVTHGVGYLRFRDTLKELDEALSMSSPIGLEWLAHYGMLEDGNVTDGKVTYKQLVENTKGLE